MKLQRHVYHAALHVSMPLLGGRRFRSGEHTGQMPVDCPVEMRPTHLQLALHVGQRELGILELKHCLAESLSLLRETDCFVESALRGSLGGHGDRQAFLRQLTHQINEALPFLPQAIRNGNADILEEQLRSVGRMLTDLVEIATTLETGGVGIEFSKIPFDLLVFTGSGQTGKSVMAAAAQNLTPVVLELGGKAPAVIDPDYPIEKAVGRIMFIKQFNAGLR